MAWVPERQWSFVDDKDNIRYEPAEGDLKVLSEMSHDEYIKLIRKYTEESVRDRFDALSDMFYDVPENYIEDNVSKHFAEEAEKVSKCRLYKEELSGDIDAVIVLSVKKESIKYDYSHNKEDNAEYPGHILVDVEIFMHSMYRRFEDSVDEACVDAEERIIQNALYTLHKENSGILTMSSHAVMLTYDDEHNIFIAHYIVSEGYEVEDYYGEIMGDYDY